MDWFDNIFDISHDWPGDDDNNDNDNNAQQDDEIILEDYYQDFDFNYIYTNVDDEDMITEKNDDNNQILKEQILSQKLSQLSTTNENEQLQEEEEGECTPPNNNKRPLSASSTPVGISKKIRLLDDHEDDDEEEEEDVGTQLPIFLQINNAIFDKIVNNHTTITMNNNLIMPVTIEDVQELVTLKHKIGIINIGRQLWTVYLKSGTGQWKTTFETHQTAVDRRLWPKQVKKIMESKLHINDQNEQQLCEDIVHEHLEKLNKTIEQYQNEYETKKTSLLSFTNELEQAIESFVQHYGLQSYETKLNYKIALLKYDYNLQILERDYLQQKPTESQIQMAKNLCKLRYDYIQAKQELKELRCRILYNKPLPDEIDFQLSSVKQSQIPQQEKNLQQNLTESMALRISEAENKMYECRTILHDEVNLISIDNNNTTMEQTLTDKLNDLIFRRFQIINQKLDCISNCRINYFLRNHLNSLQDGTTLGFSPTMIIDPSIVHHHFTDEQLKLLNRGPTYVPACQLYVSLLSSEISMNDIIEKQFKLLQHDLSIIFKKLDTNPAQSMFITKEIKDIFRLLFSISLPASLQQRAVHEKKLVESIREHLKINGFILRRTADQKNVFYLGKRKEFEEQANEYLMKTHTIEFCEDANANNLSEAHAFLKKVIKDMNNDIEKIFHNKKLFKDVLKKLYIQMDQIELPYLYFLPDVSKKNEVTLKPIVVVQQSATSRLAQFLDKILRPLIQRHMESTKFKNGTDFIRELIQHIDNDDKKRGGEHLFNSKTIFTTITISNFFNLTHHEGMITSLEDYFRHYITVPAIENISVDKIVALTRLFLRNNHFYYNNTIYRYARGSPECLGLSETLSNIYVFQWQKSLLKELCIGGELFGRCKNQIFFTWNRTSNELTDILHRFNSEYKNVQLEMKIDSCVHFLNAKIDNYQGTLYSSVYHDKNSQKYTLPYVINNSKVAHSHWLRSALIRAVRYCTSIHDFQQERFYLEVTCLANGYSLEFIQQRIDHFYLHFYAMPLLSTLDQKTYDQFRRRLFNFISEQNEFYRTNEDLKKKKQLIRLSYSYEYGPKRMFNRHLQEIISKNLNPNTTDRRRQIKLNISTKHQYSLNGLLSQQKPFHALLMKK